MTERSFRVYRTTPGGGAVAVRSFPIIGRGGLLTRDEADRVLAAAPGDGWWIGDNRLSDQVIAVTPAPAHVADRARR